MAKSSYEQVKYYTTGVMKVEVHFPERDIRCVWCPYCRDEAAMNRYWCRITNRIITNPEFAGLPTFCPLEFIAEEMKGVED